MPDHFAAIADSLPQSEIYFHDPATGEPVKGIVVSIDKAARKVVALVAPRKGEPHQKPPIPPKTFTFPAPAAPPKEEPAPEVEPENP
jgi:hypothetical protein